MPDKENSTEACKKTDDDFCDFSCFSDILQKLQLME